MFNMVENLRSRTEHNKVTAIRFFWIALSLIALIAVGVALYLTRSGPGVSGDALHYMEGGRNLLAGEGYSRLKGDGSFIPITGFPPLFSMVLAGVYAVMGPAFDVSRFVNAALFGVNIFLFGWLLLRSSRSYWVSLLGALWVLTARDMLLLHAWVMSEPLFIALSLAALHTVLSAWQSGRMRWWVLTGALTGLAIITRYTGLALAAAIGLAVLLFEQKKLTVGFAFALPAALPLAAWLSRNALIANTATGRGVAFHPPSRALVVAFFDETSSWLVPNDLHIPWKPRLMIAGVVMLFALALFAWNGYNQRRSGVKPAVRLGVVLIVYCVLYCALLVLNSLYLDASTSETGLRRYLTAMFVVILGWLLFVFHHTVWLKRRNWLPRLAMLIPAGILLAIYIYRGALFVADPGYVLGYTDIRNTAPQAVAALKAIPLSGRIYTSDFELFYYLAERPLFGLPPEIDQFSGQINPDFDEQFLAVLADVRAGAVFAVYVDPDHPSPIVDELAARLVTWQNFGRIVLYRDEAYLP